MTKKGFSLAEVMVVLVTVGIIAAYGIPNFGKAMTRAQARSAISNLQLIYSAQQLYFARQGVYVAEATTAAINGMLGNNSLNIVQTGGTTYSCQIAAAPATCTAANAAFNVVVTLTIALADNNVNPVCTNVTAGSCP
ncbi:MAG: type II secretion system protein [Candidatus Omnitrophica bacterium]|nr:type II secretion system protein [Candidatus Omnitrophota bacterium]MBF0484978.1 type II secretion system protein [Candidatus Omnitrophota bacterium]